MKRKLLINENLISITVDLMNFNGFSDISMIPLSRSDNSSIWSQITMKLLGHSSYTSDKLIKSNWIQEGSTFKLKVFHQLNNSNEAESVKCTYNLIFL
jgi:hypothetical protein